MDIVMRMMIISHEWWLRVCQRVYGPQLGSWLFIWTTRMFCLPGTAFV
jgi:hypothetical protein